MVMNLAIGEAQCRGPWSKQLLTPEYFEMFPVLERLTYALGVRSRQVLQSERFRMDESFYPMESDELSPSTWAHHLVISTEQQYTFLKRWHEGILKFLNDNFNGKWSLGFIHPTEDPNPEWHSRQWIEDELEKAKKIFMRAKEKSAQEGNSNGSNGSGNKNTNNFRLRLKTRV
ncbi:uncharacterized protein PAC_19294 [Phialocephala subalpina]|uniref:Uncharacterized protein n=1 Tax=Phialocephala subalpina TaxID=576137 RepID=A0A1L7XWI0_9HELO|nr:uncharacterized protein PAC_19294 [Phialocephala subalpina]